MPIDQELAEYYLRIAELIYQGALDHEKKGESDMATAHLEVVHAIMLEVSTGGHEVTR